MDAQISPLTIEKDEYGYISGKVASVSSWPLSTQMVAMHLNNSELADHFTKTVGEAPFEVTITLLHDSSNPADYLWSDLVQDPVKISPGVPCHGIIVIKTKKILSLIIPGLKSLAP